MPDEIPPWRDWPDNEIREVYGVLRGAMVAALRSFDEEYAFSSRIVVGAGIRHFWREAVRVSNGSGYEFGGGHGSEIGTFLGIAVDTSDLLDNLHPIDGSRTSEARFIPAAPSAYRRVTLKVQSIPAVIAYEVSVCNFNGEVWARRVGYRQFYDMQRRARARAMEEEASRLRAAMPASGHSVLSDTLSTLDEYARVMRSSADVFRAYGEADEAVSRAVVPNPAALPRRRDKAETLTPLQVAWLT